MVNFGRNSAWRPRFKDGGKVQYRNEAFQVVLVDSESLELIPGGCIAAVSFKALDTEFMLQLLALPFRVINPHTQMYTRCYALPIDDLNLRTKKRRTNNKKKRGR